MTNISDYIGKRFGRWVIASDAGFKPCNNGSPNGGRRRYVNAVCDCGERKVLSLSKVKNRETQSCGCYLKDRNTEIHSTHGLTEHPLYQVWATIKTRCYNKKHPSYRYWGRRGVKMCDEWKSDFVAFYTWAIGNGYKKGLQIDKDIIAKMIGIKPLLYSPDRCLFVTAEENSNNRKNSKKYEFNGEQLSISQWARRIGIEEEVFRNQIKKSKIPVIEQLQRIFSV